MTRLKTWLGTLFNRETVKEDSVAGLVLGFQSVPDGLAGGLLAGVNPVFGLYGYMIGTFTGALFTSATFMAVQATGAMAIVVADVPAVHSGEDQETALFTLAILTGVVMLAAGLLRLGTLLRFVSNAVMVGFISAVGVNIILGQFDNFTGYEADGANRVLRAFDTLFNVSDWQWASVAVGVATIVLIVLLERTRLGPLGMVVAIVLTSAAVPLLGWDGVLQLNDITEIPRSLPLPMLPDLTLIFVLIVPALALAFVGLVQGAGISSSFPNPDGEYPNASQDFAGQGAANLASGFFQGMPVGGSMSASSLVKEAGAKSKAALILAAIVMALTIVLLGDVVGYTAMPALAGLLMLVGFRTIKPAAIKAVWRTGVAQAVVMSVTFVLTMLFPLQYAVLAGVGISIILYVVTQSNRVTTRRWIASDGRLREVDAPETVGANEVIIIQPYGSLFFASATVFEDALPEVTEDTTNSVVVLRLRGQNDLGSTFMRILGRYAEALHGADSKLVLVYADRRIRAQLEATGLVELLGPENLYESDEWLGATVLAANDDALAWVDSSENDG